MTIRVECVCGTKLKSKDSFAGKRAECPLCGRYVTIPASPEEEIEEKLEETVSKAEAFVESRSTEELDYSHSITEYVDPPGETTSEASLKKKPSILFKMFEAMLDPRSIQWMLLLGGTLAIIGLLVWLISIGVFENKIVVAVCLGIGTLIMLGVGWWLRLKTKHHVAGQAVTFLACVVMPLNLWFYHAQNLILVTEHLWIGGFVCCLFYFATVKILKDPMFLYAAEAGVTMTVMLLLADLGKLTDSTHFSLYLIVLGLISLHADRIFSVDSAEFPREKYGMPLFWSAHLQIITALGFLLVCQSVTWGVEILNYFPPLRKEFPDLPQEFPINIATLPVLACGLWLVGVYTSLYSYLIVKPIRWATLFAGFCLVMAEVTLFKALNLEQEGMIAFLAGTALLLHLLNHFLLKEKRDLEGPITVMALGLSSIAVFWALMLHFGAINTEYTQGGFPELYQFSWGFVVATLFSAICARTLQVFTLRINPHISATYLFLSAAAVMLAASATLHLFAWDQWSHRAPVLILIPICYLIASRMYRGKFQEIPLYWVAHTGTAVVLLHVFWASMLQGKSILYVRQGDSTSLWLGLLFALAMVFYCLATFFRRRGNNIYFAAAALCGVIWQFSGYFNVDEDWYVVIYAFLGVLSLIASRLSRVEEEVRFDEFGGSKRVVRGPGLPFYQSGNTLLLITMLTAFLHANADIGASYINGAGVSQFAGWLPLLSLALSVLAILCGLMLVFDGPWKKFYILGAIVLSAQSFILINVLINLSKWQKLEIFCVILGLIILVISHIRLFQDDDEKEEASRPTSQDEMVKIGLFLGSVLAVVPVLIATFYFHRYTENVFTLDDFFLIAISVVMLVTGFSWKIKSTTLIAGGALFTYLCMIIVIIAYDPQRAIGVYLGIGGILLFGIGILLSMYRDRLLQLPERISNREGIFSIIDWR